MHYCYLESVLSSLRPWMHSLSRQGQHCRTNSYSRKRASVGGFSCEYHGNDNTTTIPPAVKQQTTQPRIDLKPFGPLSRKRVEKNGSQVVLVTPSNMDKSVDRKIRVLGVWYVLLAGLGDTETQRRGFCFVVATNAFKFGQVRHTAPVADESVFFFPILYIVPTIGPAELLCFEASPMLCGYACR